jgi:tetratricopeptide (TPR) repeat protein
MRNLHFALSLCFAIGISAPHASIASDLEEGSKLYAAKEYSKALPLLEKAAKFSPMSWQPHYYLANTNLALGKMSAAKYEYELCLRASKNPAVIAKCQEGIARADKHSSQVRSAPAAASSSSSSEGGEAKPSDAQTAITKRKEEIMKSAREQVAKVRQEAKEQLEHEKANANQMYRFEDGRIGTDVSNEREEEIQQESEEKIKKIMREAESRARGLGGS